MYAPLKFSCATIISLFSLVRCLELWILDLLTLLFALCVKHPLQYPPLMAQLRVPS